MIDHSAVDAKTKAVEEQGQRLVQNLNRQVEQAVPMMVVGGVSSPSINGVARRRAP